MTAVSDLRRCGELAFPERVIYAPDGSEIRELLIADGASMVHCTLPAGGVSMAVKHRTVTELWYVLGGAGRVWRCQPDGSETEITVAEGVCLRIATGCHFQFRADADAPLALLIVTLPPWPGMDEAERVPDHWPATVSQAR